MEWYFIKYLLLSLVLTIVIEVPLAALIGIRKKKDLLLVLLVNIVTNPVVVLSYYTLARVTSWNLWGIKAVLEVLAIACEAWYYDRYGTKIKHPIGIAVLLNAISFGIGCVL